MSDIEKLFSFKTAYFKYQVSHITIKENKGDMMLKDLFGDTPQVRVIEFMMTGYWLEYPSKKEIAEGAGISLEELENIYDDLIDTGFLRKCKNEDKHYMCSHELADGLFFIMQELKIPYRRKQEKIRLNNIKNQCKKHEKFLKINFNFDKEDLDGICEIIVGNSEMKRIIYDLPEIITGEIPKSRIDLNVNRFFVGDEFLEIDVKSELDKDLAMKKEKIINAYLTEHYLRAPYTLKVKECELLKFLEKSYEFPSDNIIEIRKFIRDDETLENMIRDLPSLISKEFPESPILLDFVDDSLEISIKSPYDGETTSNKKDIIMDEIFKKHEKPKSDYYISMEFLQTRNKIDFNVY